MGATYTRQSSFTDGDVITADLFNNEYDQLLAAFASSTGHTHDGTAAEGGPITKLLGTSITIGDATSGTDITITFDGVDGKTDQPLLLIDSNSLNNSTEAVVVTPCTLIEGQFPANNLLDGVSAVSIAVVETTAGFDPEPDWFADLPVVCE